MGLFSFIEAAGRLLTGEHAQHPDAVQDESKPVPPPPPAEAIGAELARLGLPGMQVTTAGSTATVTGTAADPATREKAILAAGNVAGIAQVNDTIQVQGTASDTENAAAQPRFHTVVKGETLSGIAQQACGHANKYMLIFEANKPMLSDPNKIYPGQVLRIPPEA